jgi:homopolymeric O-antigen transport system ATP-binding protein
LTNAIEVENVSKRFRIPLDRSTTLKYRMVHPRSTSRFHDLYALDDVSFSVPFGEFIGVIGANGSGKSTLLNILAGIYKPTRGKVAVYGHVSPFLELGVGFNPELTARENVYVNGAVLGLSRRELAQRMEGIIHFAELENFVDQKLKNFSSGMQVRLAFSVAIQADAAVLLMDEVLAVGDARFQAKCFDIFARYKREGRTVVLVTHDLGSVDNYCDRTLYLEHGRLIDDGPSTQVTSHYRRRVGEEQEADAAEPGAAPRLRDDMSPEQRWGTGEMRVTEVSFLDADGQPHHTFNSGSPMTVRIDYKVLKDAMQGGDILDVAIGFHRADGMLLSVTGTHGNHMDPVPPPAGESGLIEYHIPNLALLGGSYRLTVSLVRKPVDTPMDHLEQVYEFRVVDEVGRPGLFDLRGTWDLCLSEPAAAEPAPRPDRPRARQHAPAVE